MRENGDRDLRRQLQIWLGRSPGLELAQAEAERLRAVLSDLFGYHLLQVGSLAGADLLQTSRVLNRVLLEADARFSTSPYTVLEGTACCLPFASDSLDVVVLPHVLEFEPNPHAALREAGRVLVPEGHLVATGFNPWSLFGLARVVRRRRGVPWQGRFLGVTRVRDWLALLGLETLLAQTLFYRPPFANERVMDRMHGIERVGERFWPYLGGIWLVVARKRVATLTPIKPRWRPRRSLLGARIIEPTTRR